MIPKKGNLKDLVPKFDPKAIDISLFLMIFERQAAREKIDDGDLVSQLIPLLPIEVSEQILKEPDDKAYDFTHVKRLLFKRFKLSSRALRNKFETHNRKPDALWSDLVYELRGYLNNWLESVGVEDFESLKELMLTEQLKKRVPLDIREHYVDSWDELNDATSLAEKCDKFESVRKDQKRFERRTFGQNSFKKTHKFNPSSDKTNGESKLDSARSENDGSVNGKESVETKDKNVNRNFDKRRKITCFHCRRDGHIRPQCPELAEKVKYPVNNLNLGCVLSEGFVPYINTALINGEKRSYLRDSGTILDVCESDMVSVEDLLPENVWIRQPLDASCKCLPLARIAIETDCGTIITKAAVKPAEVSQGYYLMGNTTAKLIEEKRKQSACPLNSTGMETRIQKEQYIENETRGRKSNDNNSPSPTEGEENISIKPWRGKEKSVMTKEIALPRIKTNDGSLLATVTASKVITEQKKNETTKEIRKGVGVMNECESEHVNNRLIRNYKSKRKAERQKLIVPLTYSRLCSDEISLLNMSVNGNKNDGTVSCPTINSSDVISMKDLSLKTIVHAIIQSFPKMGFPRGTQSDLGVLFIKDLRISSFEKDDLKMRIPILLPPQDFVNGCLKMIKGQVSVDVNPLISRLTQLRIGYSKLIESIEKKPEIYRKEELNSIVNLALEKDYENSKMKLCKVEQSDLFCAIDRDEIDAHIGFDSDYLCITFNATEGERRYETRRDMHFMVGVNFKFNTRDNWPANRSESVQRVKSFQNSLVLLVISDTENLSHEIKSVLSIIREKGKFGIELISTQIPNSQYA